MPSESAPDERPGIRFALVDGRRSSSRTGASIVADSLATTNSELSARVRACTNWRKQYAPFMAAATRASVSNHASLALAREGLSASRRHLVHRTTDGDEFSVETYAAETPARGRGRDRLRDELVVGTRPRQRQLVVPYRGQLLTGATLHSQLDRWVEAGSMEPGFAASVRRVIEDPSALRLPDYEVVLLGAGAALGPLESLLSWGADVTAVDIPRPELWDRLRMTAAHGAGRMRLPVHSTTGSTGVDLGADLTSARRWLSRRWSADASPIVGMYAYADGPRHVELSVAADVIATDALENSPSAMLAYLNTPTDAFLVPADAVAVARERWDTSAWNGPLHRFGRAATAGHLFRPSYTETYFDDTGTPWSLVDTLVDVQGPNYALAKRIQRWRGVDAWQAGRRVSSTVAPASWTTSVTRNKVLASVYAGAHHFGVEIFRPETAAPLLAAKLVADATKTGLKGPEDHPESLFAVDALHGGLWRQPFEPRTALSVAAALGAPQNILRRDRT